MLYEGLEVHLVNLVVCLDVGWRWWRSEEFVSPLSGCHGWKGGKEVGMFRQWMFPAVREVVWRLTKSMGADQLLRQ